ncbi:S41 family peptidase [Proteinivorax hydrogeniformans]|uniref:S41 family peptidase n=1 Tax=Proteinivorax hydrogeniformans TaxID=1826727 RepID=A0AAU8HV07_9FIRM
MHKKWKLSLLALALVVSHLAIFSIGYYLPQQQSDVQPEEPLALESDFSSKTKEIIEVIQNNFFGDYDLDEIEDAVYREIVAALGDPYSEYMSVDDVEDFGRSYGQSYGGIGVEVTLHEDRVTVVVPMAGSPGQAAGLLPGDQIVEVDGKDVEGKGLSEVVDMILGEPDTVVELGIIREGVEGIIDFEVTRAIIDQTAAESEMLDDRLGYIELTRFSDGSYQEFVKHLNGLKESNMEELILDLRGNPGGGLNEVLNIANHLVPEGKIVYIEDSDGQRLATYTSDLKERDFELVVLIDENSASASEILAGALKDHEAATIIGTTTFGKGSVQNIIDLSDGSAVKLTVSNFFTPEGNIIDGVGVSPHIEVGQVEGGNFPPLRYTSSLEREDSGAQVMVLQNILEFLNYPAGAYGTFDEDTQMGVEQFQADYGLEKTGVVNLEVAEKLNEVLEQKQREKDKQLIEAIDYFRN